MSLSDLEATRLCAMAMGLHKEMTGFELLSYNPLHDDSQALALVKRFKLCVADQTRGVYAQDAAWSVWRRDENDVRVSHGWQDNDLNRAIVYAVAAIQEGKK